MPSQRFAELEEQLISLRGHLLPATFDPTGIYEDHDGVQTRALAYRVMAHAEIESFFEDRTLDVVRRAQLAWENGEHVSRVIVCLLGFSGKEMASPPPTLEAPGDNKRKAWPMLIDIGKRLSPVISDFHYFVRVDNHGVKEKNLLSLLLPIGVDHRKIDQSFLADMDSFGSLRGMAAHSSSRTTVRQAINPEEELSRVNALLPGIRALDKEIDDLLNGIP